MSFAPPRAWWSAPCWALVLLALVLPRLAALGLDPPESIAPFAARDEGFYTRNVRCLMATGQPSLEGWLVSSTSVAHAIWVGALAWLEGGVRLPTARLVSTFSILGAAALPAAFLWRRRSPTSALVFLALVACDPLLLVTSLHVTPYGPALLASSAALVLAAGSEEWAASTRGRSGWTGRVLAGALAGVATTIKEHAQALAAIMCEALWSARQDGRGSAWRRLTGYALGAAIPIAAQIMFIGTVPASTFRLIRGGFLSHFGDSFSSVLFELLWRRNPTIALGWMTPAAILALPTALALLLGPKHATPAGRLDRMMLGTAFFGALLPMPLAQQFPRYYLPLALAVAWLGARTLCDLAETVRALRAIVSTRRGARVLGLALLPPLFLLLHPFEKWCLGASGPLPHEQALVLAGALSVLVVMLLRTGSASAAVRTASMTATALVVLAVFQAATCHARFYVPGLRTEAGALAKIAGRFKPGEAVLANEAEILLLEEPVCPVAPRSTVTLAPTTDGFAALDAVTGQERARMHHAVLLRSEWREFKARHPEIAAHLVVVDWVHTSWDGGVAVLQWQKEPAAPR